jgi:hypothetical protein
MKEKLSTLKGVGGGEKRAGLIKEWFDDEKSAQVEFMHFPVSISVASLSITLIC